MSRLAWLSVALSDWRTSACLHEPLARASDAAWISRALDATRCKFAGISDAGLPIMLPELPFLMPGPIVIVDRDPVDVINSLTAYFGGDDPEVHAVGVALMQAKLEDFACECAKQQGALHVDFEQLTEMYVMRSVWEHLLPGEPFQRRRIEALQRLSIESRPEQLLEGVSDEARAAVANAERSTLPA